MTSKKHLSREIERLLTARLLWAVIPAQHALHIQSNGQMADMVTWSLNNLAEDVRTILERYDITRRSVS
jgi:hypothetical protein